MYPTLQFVLVTFLEHNMTENCKSPILVMSIKIGTVDNLRQIGL